MYFLQKIWIKAIQLNNWILFLSTLLLLGIGTFLVYELEPETFGHPFNAFWWVMTTVTTVGYGDYFPVTVPGKIVALFLYIFGIGLIGVVIGKILDSFSMLRKRRLEGLMDYKGSGHYMIVGWSRKAKFALDEMLHSTKDRDILIVDELEKSPYLHERVFFVNGDPTDPGTYARTSLADAEAVIVFADPSIEDHALRDGKTLLVATTLERLAPRVHTVVEIVSEEHIRNFQHVSVDEFILSDGMISRLAARSTVYKGVTGIFRQLISKQVGEDLYRVEKKPAWKTYRDAFDDLLRMGATLVADGNRLDINRRLDQPLPDEASLYVICNEETYEKISGGA